MEKFLWILLFSRLFPAPLWLRPFDCRACRVAVGAQRGGFSAKQPTKGSLVSLCKAWGSWGFHLVQICNSSAFPCSIHTVTHHQPGTLLSARQSRRNFSLLLLFSLVFGCCSLVPPKPPCLEPAYPKAPVIHCLTSSSASISADTWDGCWVTASWCDCEIQIRACFAVLSGCTSHCPWSSATLLTASSQNDVETRCGNRTTGGNGSSLLRKKVLEVTLCIWHRWLQHGSFGMAKIWK